MRSCAVRVRDGNGFVDLAITSGRGVGGNAATRAGHNRLRCPAFRRVRSVTHVPSPINRDHGQAGADAPESGLGTGVRSCPGAGGMHAPLGGDGHPPTGPRSWRHDRRSPARHGVRVAHGGAQVTGRIIGRASTIAWFGAAIGSAPWGRASCAPSGRRYDLGRVGGRVREMPADLRAATQQMSTRVPFDDSKKSHHLGGRACQWISLAELTANFERVMVAQA